VKQTDPQLKLRLPPALKKKIEKAASDGRRPLSSEIIARLERSFEDEAKQAGGMKLTNTAREMASNDLSQRIAKLEERVNALSVPDFIVPQRLEELEERLAKLEENCPS
jgi:chaperonin cofactor prefoldin